jgi:ABC-type protease/lipase transport system fused ATPase/permease subunit
MIAHRASALQACDKVLLVRDGTQQAFGPRDEVLSKLAPPRAPAAQPAAASMGTSLKIVGPETAGGGR